MPDNDNKNADGRRSSWFKPGQSGNPNGRPKVVAEVRDLARQYAPEALSTLADIMRDSKSPPAARVAAASAVLDRGYGKPSQYIETNPSFVESLTEAQRDALIAALETYDGIHAEGDEALH
jgi:HEAT repeat protein